MTMGSRFAPYRQNSGGSAASASASVASGSGSGAEERTGKKAPKALRCAFPGCGKSFTRKDHLIRHAANHSSPNFHCSVCGRAFQRMDLLQRHERRQICDADDRRSKKADTAQRGGSSERSPSSSISPEQPLDRPLSSGSASHLGMHPLYSPSGSEYTPPTANLGLHTSPHPPADHADELRHPGLKSMFADDYSLPVPELHPAHTLEAPVSLAPGVEVDFGPNAANPLVYEHHQADFGYGLWPPDPWETLLHDALGPAFWDETKDAWDFDTLAPRQLQSSERDSDALLARISYPLGLSGQELGDALEAYWKFVAPSFPFIHRATFDAHTAPEELVVMMALTGLARRRGRNDRVLVKKIRARLIEDRMGLEMELPTLQAFTLCHVHDVWHGDTESLFVAQCMWPVVVAHARKQGIGVAGGSAPEGHGTAAWVAWAKDEERRRAAYCILSIDTQISLFWSQHPSRQLSIFAHNIHLPAPRTMWEATSAADWLRARESAPDTQPRKSSRGYLPGLHPEFQVSVVSEGYSSAVLAALAADGGPPIRVDVDNSFTVSMLLVGLGAIAWDCRTRGGMGIRFRDGTKHWRAIVLNAVVSLRAAYELASGHLPSCIETRDIRDSLAISIISILSDIPMLQVAAGATHLCGATIGPKQYADGRRRLRLWAGTTDAWTCLWQSARYLRESLLADWGLYSPWAVFLTTLVVWAYGAALGEGGSAARGVPGQDPTQGATALLDRIFASPTRVEGVDGVVDLLVTAAARLEQLGGEIDRDHAQILWRLAGVKR